MQRFCDIILSFLGLVLLFPILIPVIILLKFTGEGEIFYLQERVGRNGKIFLVKKFATMLKNSSSMDLGSITIKNDPRILPLGGFLRKSKINELPQLLNILRGDMSFIGPRPLTSETFSAYSTEVQLKISSVLPGLSGVGSIMFRDEESLLGSAEDSVAFYHEVVAPYKGALESWYVKNISLVNYFKLILLTIIVVIFPKSRLIWSMLQDHPEPPEGLRILK